ncbi:MAG: TldD/PmbA family protein [Nitrospiraceae bacterium]|nr:TldD/PmbA family protein [Nitrospiraceae bacterium]
MIGTLNKETEFLARRLVEMAIEGGADAAEAYINSKTGVSAESKDGAPESVKTSRDKGCALRVIKGGKLGFSYSNDMENITAVVQAALEASGYTGEDPFLKLPVNRTATECPQIFDQAIAGMSTEEAFELAARIEQGARGADKRIKLVRSATASFGSSEVLIVNSNGFSGCYSSTSATAQTMAVAEGEGGETQMGWDFMGSAFLEDVSFEEVGRGAAGKALELLGAKHISPMKSPVVIANSVAAEFLGIFASMLSAESVQKGKSLLAGRLGQEVISSALSIFDDGLLPRGLGSAPFDDEGVPTSRKGLIEAGVLKGYMHNTYTAAKDGSVSTGNAVKSGLASFPSVGPLNFYLKEVFKGGNSRGLKLEDLFAQAGKGLYVTEAMGMHMINPVSGEFSIGVSGLLIEGGKTSHAVKEAVISGNLLDFFKNVEAVADDLRFYGGTGSPSILIGPTDISA